MNFIIPSIISILAASVAQADNFATDRTSSLSYDRSDCSVSSSSSCSFSSSGSSPLACQNELMSIEAQANTAAAQYFRSLQAQIESANGLWFNPNTQIETAMAFSRDNGIIVRVYNAMGKGFEFPQGTALSGAKSFSHMRAEALNKGVFAKGMPTSAFDFYSFQMFTSSGGYVMIELVAPKNKLPLGNLINIKRNTLRNFN